jgi:hypothetical protein
MALEMCKYPPNAISDFTRLQGNAIACKSDVSIPVAAEVRQFSTSCEFSAVEWRLAHHFDLAFMNHMLPCQNFQERGFPSSIATQKQAA